MISSIYASVLALLIVWLSLRVIKLRRANQVLLGDGGHQDLQNAIRAQGNAAEYIPIALILLLLLELSQAHFVIINFAGIVLVIGRLLHAKGLLTESVRYRVLGMQCTLYTIITLAILNLAYFLFTRLGYM